MALTVAVVRALVARKVLMLVQVKTHARVKVGCIHLQNNAKLKVVLQNNHFTLGEVISLRGIYQKVR
jgi:capsule polysaccharide export protein KpsC/LpsZ